MFERAPEGFVPTRPQTGKNSEYAKFVRRKRLVLEFWVLREKSASSFKKHGSWKERSRE